MRPTAHCRLESVTLDIPIADKSALRAIRRRRQSRGIGTAPVPGSAKGGKSIRALDDVSLLLEAGDRVGLIGPNGAGKTTLLRVVAGIVQPTRGRITRRGRVSTLQPLKPGGPDTTGYDSVRLHGSLLGLRRGEIEGRFDEIAAFSELGDRLALPAKTFSSGMKARLTFATYASFAPEFLLIDEWINTIDRQFMDKVQRRLEELSERAGVLVVASHQPDLLVRLCSTGILLDAGRVRAVKPIREALSDA